MSISSGKIAKTQRSRRELAHKAPKLVENVKTALGIRGPNCSQLVGDVMRDLHKFKAPHSKLLTKRNLTRPFEDASSVEFLAKVNDASLFAYGSHSKKRPHNLVLGRLFDAQLLDMFEFGLNGATFQGMEAFEGVRKAVVRVGSKPALVFQGESWDSNADLVLLRNFFLDFFRGEVLPKINLSALDRVIILTAREDGTVHFRHYGVALRKSATHLPRVELDEVGPRMDLTLRRRKSAPAELSAVALKQPKVVTKAGKNFQKNFGTNAMGDQTARIHMQRQDLANLNVARLKGLQGAKRKRAQDAEGDADLEQPDGGVQTDGDGMMVDAGASSARSARAASARARPASAASAAAASTSRRMGLTSNSNAMDEFGGSASVASSLGGNRRAPAQDKNLQRKKAGGFGAKPIEGGYRDLAAERQKKKQRV